MRPSVVYIDRTYEDQTETPQPWDRWRRSPGEREWLAASDTPTGVENSPGFDDVKDAITWGMAHAEVVLVRLGSSTDAWYSAGTQDAAVPLYDPGAPVKWRFPSWPPSSWPDYAGPPEQGWPAPPDLRSA